MSSRSARPLPERPPERRAEVVWHALSAEDVLRRLESRPEGLTQAEAAARLDEVGPNVLPSAPPRSAWRILLDQLRSVIVLLLVGAAAVSLLAGDVVDATAIAAVLVINAAIGFTTELRARRAMHALLQLDVPRATVIRENTVADIDARSLVPGDVIEIEAGQSVPADARILSGTELSANEAPLTGESAAVTKRADAMQDADTALAERTPMLYKATAVVTGHGRAVVVSTGEGTEVGRIGDLVRGVEETRTPLERRLDQLGRRLIWATLVAVAAVAVVGLLRGATVIEMMEIAISLAVAAVPEGLVAIATITMAVGVRRMARRRASIRRLPVVETLGSVTLVCTDKTGTLTMGEMTATTWWVADHEYTVSGAGYEAEGEITLEGAPVRTVAGSPLEAALRIAVLANRADVRHAGCSAQPRGDPTEAALIVAARKAGLDRGTLIAEWPEVGEVPFSSERKLMATFHRSADGRLIAAAKGAPLRMLELSDRRMDANGESPLDDGARSALLRTNERLAARGLRVLGLTTGEVTAPEERALRGLMFVGFVGIVDPPAPRVRETILQFHDAGIRTVMLTGDQRLTAAAIAKQLGLLERDDQVVDGRELEHLSDDELASRLADTHAVSRVSPRDKLRVVDAFQRNGEIVAMLGDGVNDAPALKTADVGVAMGGRGTDVAKEAASVVLQDDRFETIAAAIEEGRVIFQNIRKFVFYLFSCNLAEVLVLLVAGIAGLPLPLLPLQILWLNLVTDTFPALALALEPAEPNVMRRPSQDPRSALLSGAMLRAIATYSAMITGVTIAGFAWALSTPALASKAVTMSFLTLSLAQIFHLGNARSVGPVVERRAVLRNRYALGAVGLTVLLQVLAVHWPPLSRTLATTALGTREWLVALGLGLVPAVIGQALKLWRGRSRREGSTSPRGQ